MQIGHFVEHFPPVLSSSGDVSGYFRCVGADIATPRLAFEGAENSNISCPSPGKNAAENIGRKYDPESGGGPLQRIYEIFRDDI
ncbi:hypothetical protein RJ40_10485 [Methanofollis aquaemaris]|uniref:Uncharacterized protein n=1 Tax=Methanofollis aquaemaris TaxID=126734 RepID=A0A8A3S875_9EURY|nr:hypothetical protein [Methanofollis aquaemaris]QSZ67890.1 hypothetical protein RJ40_10485 [Methanofollis aquaemaris]